VLKPGETFAATVCNPPFHASAAEAAEGTRRKLRNLGAADGRNGPPRLNFGGRPGELWCAGGERGFLLRLIAESARHGARIGWFSTLVSKASNLVPLRAALRQAGAAETRTIEMAQGQKTSRLLAWSYLGRARRAALVGGAGSGVRRNDAGNDP
jgi:23S rRNA (adenine1618-N6)-methyltransferase